jgi:phasin family protein
MLTPEQVAATQQANLATLFGLTSKVVEGVEKLAELNLQVIKSTLAETQENTLKALSVKEPHEWLALQATLTAPTAEKVQSYSRHLFEIVSATQAEFARIAQTEYDVYNRRVQTLVEDVAQSAPAGSEAAVAAWQSAITATNTLVETLQKTGQQAVQVAESNFDIATDVASKTARRAVEQASTGAKR